MKRYVVIKRNVNKNKDGGVGLTLRTNSIGQAKKYFDFFKDDINELGNINNVEKMITEMYAIDDEKETLIDSYEKEVKFNETN